MYSCYGGLSLQDAISAFKDRNNTQVVTLSKSTLPTSSLDSNMDFSSVPEILNKELSGFPKNFINKYLINMHACNNVIGVYENVRIYFTLDLIGKIEEKYFLEYLTHQ